MRFGTYAQVVAQIKVGKFFNLLGDLDVGFYGEFGRLFSTELKKFNGI